jgi:hypothetical protein
VELHADAARHAPTTRPSARARPIDKGGTFSQIDCDGYVSGTSGGPFIIGGDDPKVVGVTGGWQTGGHSADTSYSSSISTTTRGRHPRKLEH